MDIGCMKQRVLYNIWEIIIIYAIWYRWPWMVIKLKSIGTIRHMVHIMLNTNKIKVNGYYQMYVCKSFKAKITPNKQYHFEQKSHIYIYKDKQQMLLFIKIQNKNDFSNENDSQITCCNITNIFYLVNPTFAFNQPFYVYHL